MGGQIEHFEDSEEILMPETQQPNQNGDDRVILIHGFSREETVTIMRAVKSAAQDPQGIAFTTSTPSNLEWKLRDLITEVRGEHEFMRNNPPKK